MVFLAFLYAGVMTLAFLLGWRHRGRAGASWMLAFLGLDAAANWAAYLSWWKHRPNQWAGNLGTLVALAGLLPAFAAWGFPELRRPLQGLAVAAVLLLLVFWIRRPLWLPDDLAYPIACLLLVLAAGSVLGRLVTEPQALASRMPFWMAAGVILAFGVDLLPWVLKDHLQASQVKTLWTLRNASWTGASLCFAYGWRA